jgi:hypothetical protein
MFVEILRRKAGSAGGEANEFSVKNKLSKNLPLRFWFIRRNFPKGGITANVVLMPERNLY